jgi:esterase/lipase
MDEKTQKKLSIMESVLTKMEDLENSQQSLIGKIGQIEVELFDLNSPDLDKELAKVIDRASETLDMIASAKVEFEAKHDAIVKKNSPPKSF